MDKFIMYWLKVIAALHVLGGLSLAFNFPEFLWQNYIEYLYSIFGVMKNSNTSPDASIITLSVIRLLGPTIASWGILMWFLVGQIYQQKSKNSAVILLAATLVWYIFDCYVSYQYGIMMHLLLNTAAMLSIVLPVFWTLFYLKKYESAGI